MAAEYEVFEKFEKKKIIYFVAALIAAFTIGLGYTWSIIQTPLVQKLGGDSVTATVVLCYTVTVLFSTMSPTVLGGFTKHLKANQMVILGGALFGIGYLTCGHISTPPMLFLTYALGTGLGTGFIYPTLMGYAASILPKKQGIASGLMAGVYGGAAIIWSPILARIIENNGLTSTFNLIGILSLILLIGAGLIIKPVPKGYVAYKKSGIATSGNKAASTKNTVIDLNRGQMIKTGMFYVTLIAFAFGLTSGMMVISQASQILQKGYSMTALQAAGYVSLISLMSMTGRILWGAVTDHTNKYITLCIICTLPILTMGILATSPSVGLAIACMSVTALCYGGFGGTITPITADLFGTKYITENYGVMYLTFGIAGLIGPRVAVTLQNGGNYSKPFMVGAFLALISLIAANIVRTKVKSGTKNA